MKKQLEQLGFSQNEAKVYLALLDLGQTSTGAGADKWVDAMGDFLLHMNVRWCRKE